MDAALAVTARFGERAARHPTVLVLGKVPPPFMGPAIATRIILDSSLRERFDLDHLDTRVSSAVEDVGRVGLTKLLGNLRLFLRMARLVRQAKPNVALVPISQSTIGFLRDSVFVLLAKRRAVPVLLHLRGSTFRTWLESAPLPVRWYAGAVIGRSAGAIVQGEGLRRIFEGILPDERIFVVPNGADYPQLPPRDSGEQDGPIRVLYLGNLQPSKGIEDVIHAAALVNTDPDANLPEFRLDVVGAWRDAATRQRCENIATAAGLGVTFHGAETGDRKFRFLRDADVFIFSPREPEGHPWAVVEALAASLPVIATPMGAIPDCVIHGRNGFLAPPANPEALAGYLRDLVASPELRRAFGRASRAMYEERFTESQMIERLASALYHVARPFHSSLRADRGHDST